MAMLLMLLLCQFFPNDITHLIQGSQIPCEYISASTTQQGAKGISNCDSTLNNLYGCHNNQPSVKGKHITTSHTVKSHNFIFITCLLLSGDIHPCPGPRQHIFKYPCVSCSVTVRSNSKAISCDNCEEWTHLKCCDMSIDSYNSLALSDNDFCF